LIKNQFIDKRKAIKSILLENDFSKND
jgi:hypothetical protein